MAIYHPSLAFAQLPDNDLDTFAVEHVTKMTGNAGADFEFICFFDKPFVHPQMEFHAGAESSSFSIRRFDEWELAAGHWFD